MTQVTQAQTASRLLELHHASNQPLVLINAWDAASAAVIAERGLPAIATSSAAVANALGYADGQHVPWTEMLTAIERIVHTVNAHTVNARTINAHTVNVQAVPVPVTADIEAGFAADVTQLETSIGQVIATGAVGVNLEDALPGHEHFGPLYPLAEQVERIQAARRTGEKLKVHLVINARTDAYWQKGASPESALRNTIERGKAYLRAGADCIFVPGLRSPEHIKLIVDELQAPVNVLVGPGVPSLPELARMGVRRVSYGSGPHRAAMGLLRRIADEARISGTYTALTDGAVPYAEMNGMVGK